MLEILQLNTLLTCVLAFGAAFLAVFAANAVVADVSRRGVVSAKRRLDREFRDTARERARRGGDGFVHLPRPARADDRGRDLRMVQHAGNRDLRRRSAVAIRDPLQLVDVEARLALAVVHDDLVEERMAAAPVVARQRLQPRLGHRPREQT